MANALVALVLFLMGVCAWGGAGWLVMSLPPQRPLATAGLFVFLFVAICTSFSLLAWLLSRPRDARGKLRSPAAFIGHSTLLATLALFALWLQSLRMLSPAAAILLAGLYALLELALLFGTRGSVDREITSHRYGTADL